MKEIFEDRKFIPLQHIRFMQDILELPSPSEAPTHTPPPIHPPPVAQRVQTSMPLRPLVPCPTCWDANFFHIWHALLRTPTPPYAPMPPTPPASPSPLLLPIGMPDMDTRLLPALAPPHQAPCAPPPIATTDNTYQVVYNRQLPDSTLEILAQLIANKEAPPTPEALLIPINYTSLYQGHMVPPLTPVPHVPALSLLEPDPPPGLPAPEPPNPPDPPGHSSGCYCTPCLAALDELYN